MKNKFPLLLLQSTLLLLIICGLSSCKKVYVVKPEDIQTYLAQGKDLDIKLPEDAYFKLIKMDGKEATPADSARQMPSAPTAPADTSGGANGQKKYKTLQAGMFAKAYGQSYTGYRCPPVCEIIIVAPK